MTGDTPQLHEPAIEEVPAPEPRRPFIERHGISYGLFAILTLIGLFIVYQGIGGVITILLFGAKPGPNDAILLRIVTAGSELLLLALPVLLLTRLASDSTRSFLRLRVPPAGLLLLPAVGVIALQEMAQVYLMFQDRIPLPPEITTVLDQFKQLVEELTRLLAGASTPGELVGVILGIALVPALAEELLFRGLVMRSFERVMSPWRAVVITGIIFGLYHFNPTTFVPLTLLGCYLGFMAYRAQSLWVSVAGHFYNNAFACVMLYYGKDDSLVAGGNPDTMTTGALLLNFWLFGVIFLLATFYFLKLTHDPAAESTEVDDDEAHVA